MNILKFYCKSSFFFTGFTDIVRIGSVGRIHPLITPHSLHELTKNVSSIQQLKDIYQQKVKNILHVHLNNYTCTWIFISL